MYDLCFRSYSFMIIYIVLTFGLYKILNSVSMVSRMIFVCDFISFGPLLNESISPRQSPQNRGILLGFKQLWLPSCFIRASTHQYQMQRFYRMANMNRILSTLALLSLHLTRLYGIPIKMFPKLVNKRILSYLWCSC